MTASGIAARARETTLPNGIRLVVEERRATETVAVRIVVGGGTLDELPGPRGVAELHARLLTRGTEGKSGAELARAAEELGGRLSASAALRDEVLDLDVPAENLAPALALLSEVLLHPRFDPADLEKEKSLLVGSSYASADDPSSFLDDELFDVLFHDHPLSRLIRLKEPEVRAVTVEDVRAFQARCLAANRIALVVVGNCDAKEVERMAGELLASGPQGAPNLPQQAMGPDPARITPGERVRSSSGGAPTVPPLAPGDLTPPTALASDIRLRVRRRTMQPEIMIALPTQGISDDDAPAYSVLRHILGGFQERLYAEIREKRAYAYWLQLEGLALPTAGWIGVRTGARKKNLPAIEKIVRAELARLASEAVSAEELEIARRYLTTSEARLDATNAGRGSVISSALVAGRPVRAYEERIALIASVTPDQIQSLARRLFAGNHLAVVVLY